MFGFAAVSETPFSAELTKYTIGVDLANVSAASALNPPQFSGGVNLPALTGVSATLTNATLDINGKANITTANVASTTSIHVKVVEYNRFSQVFESLIEKSKYEKWKNFGRWPEGLILLQDHGNKVSFKNIKIREF